MRILMQNRFDLFTTGPGDRAHFLGVYEHLKKYGIEVDYSLELSPNLAKYDLVHLFNITRTDTYFQALNARKWNKPIILTPIYIPTDSADRFLNKQNVKLDIKDKIKNIIKKNSVFKELALFLLYRHKNARGVKSLEYNGPKFYNCQKQIFKIVNLITPGSFAEVELIKKDFGESPDYKVIYVGIDTFSYNATPHLFLSKFGNINNDFVLSVGMLCPRKNQLSVINSVSNTGLRLVIIGDAGKSSTYLKMCREAAKNHEVIFLNPMDRLLLASAYAACKVHVLASFSETTGRVTFEAGLSKANIVVSNIPVHKEYCGSHVWYCEPSDVQSIRNAVTDAFQKAKKDKFAQFILQNYTWDKMAKNVISAYEQVLGKIK